MFKTLFIAFQGIYHLVLTAVLNSSLLLLLAFMQGGYNRLYKSVCGYLTPTLASLSIIIIIKSFFDMLAILFAIWVNRNWTPKPAPPEQDNRAIPPNQEARGPGTYESRP